MPIRNENTGCYEMVIASYIDNVEKVEELTEQISTKMNFPEEERDSIAIAVTEAVNNAILHGNRQNPQKKVFIRICIESNAIRIIVRDEGEGFDPDKVPNPLDPENLLKESGRGIFILKSLMDEVGYDFSHGGTEICMVKYKKQA